MATKKIATLASILTLGTLGLAHAGHAADHGIYFDPTFQSNGKGSVEVTFGIEEAAKVSIVAFDAQGKELGTVFEGTQPSGYHHLSLFSNSLQTRPAHVFFQLRAGGSVLGEMLASL